MLGITSINGSHTFVWQIQRKFEKRFIPYYFNFSSIRDSMVLEMVLPKLFKKSDVSILNTWREEVARLAVTIPDDSNGKKDLFEMISPLFEDLMSPGNELMEI